ncbi:MAG: anti-sigma factor antagonist [Eubacterium sp.]|nr:anti-sigma factor antagonist [Eubacterium sp.]
MNIIFSRYNNILIAAPNGDLDHHNIEKHRQETDRHFKLSNSRSIIFDLKGVTFIDSSGIGYILGRYKQSLFAGGKTCFVNVPDHIKRLLSVSGLLKIIEVYPSIDEAISAIQRKGEKR